MRVQLLGDSLTVGTGAQYQKLDPDAVVIAKTGAMLAWMAEQPLLSGRRVLLMGGSNDLVGDPPKIVFERLVALVKAMQAKGIDVLVGTIPELRITPTLQVKSIEYNALIAASSLPWVEIGGHITDDMYAGDNVHLTPAGYRRMAENWQKSASTFKGVATSPRAQDSAGNGLWLLLGALAIGAIITTRKG